MNESFYTYEGVHIALLCMECGFLFNRLLVSFRCNVGQFLMVCWCLLEETSMLGSSKPYRSLIHQILVSYWSNIGLFLMECWVLSGEESVLGSGCLLSFDRTLVSFWSIVGLFLVCWSVSGEESVFGSGMLGGGKPHHWYERAWQSMCVYACFWVRVCVYVCVCVCLRTNDKALLIFNRNSPIIY